MWEQPFGEVELPPGDEPLVLVAPSTAQDPEQRMLRAALEGLAGEPVRVLATTNRRPPARAAPRAAECPRSSTGSRTRARCRSATPWSCHAGHGTMVRALSCGVPVVACPAAGDMDENAARVAWAGAGVALPRRLTTPRGVRLARAAAAVRERYARRARELRDWALANDGAGGGGGRGRGLGSRVGPAESARCRDRRSPRRASGARYQKP